MATLAPIVHLSAAEFPELWRPGGLLRIDSADVGAVWVTTLDGEMWTALSAVCPHQGCTVRPSGDGFRCPCHDSRFDEEGHRTGGPAPRSLSRFRVTREKRTLTVDLRRAEASA